MGGAIPLLPLCACLCACMSWTEKALPFIIRKTNYISWNVHWCLDVETMFRIYKIETFTVYGPQWQT